MPALPFGPDRRTMDGQAPTRTPVPECVRTRADQMLTHLTMRQARDALVRAAVTEAGYEVAETVIA